MPRGDRRRDPRFRDGLGGDVMSESRTVELALPHGCQRPLATLKSAGPTARAKQISTVDESTRYARIDIERLATRGLTEITSRRSRECIRKGETSPLRHVNEPDARKSNRHCQLGTQLLKPARCLPFHIPTADCFVVADVQRANKALREMLRIASLLSYQKFTPWDEISRLVVIHPAQADSRSKGWLHDHLSKKFVLSASFNKHFYGHGFRAERCRFD